MTLKEDYNIKKIGNYISDTSQCGVVIAISGGCFSTLSAGVHGYCNSNLLEIKKDGEGTKIRD